MEAGSESEITIINNSFYPEKIIFCVDISGEMNQRLDFSDLPYPIYKEAESYDNFQTQTLSVPTSTNTTPEGSPKISHKAISSEAYTIIEPMNASSTNVATTTTTTNASTSTTIPATNINKFPPQINQNNNGIISDTTISNTVANNNNNSNNSNNSNNNNSNNNNNNNSNNNNDNNNNNTSIYSTGSKDNSISSLNTYNNDVYNNNNNNNNTLSKSSSIKNLANSAKKLLSKNKDDDSGMSDSNSRSSSPIKNLLKGNNDGSGTGSPSLNFLKSSYSNVVQNVFNNNHSRASSNSSTGSLNSLSNSTLNTKDYPALKQPIELSRLEAVKRYIKRFVSLKGSLCKDHQYALVLLGVDAIWVNINFFLKKDFFY